MRDKERKLSRRAMIAGAAIAPIGASLGRRAHAASRQVVMYSANADVTNKIAAKGFEKATGLKLNVVSAGSGVLFRRLEAEQAHPQADVIWGVSSSLLKTHRSLLAPYESKEAAAVPALYRSASNLWLGTNQQILTINQNTHSIPAGEGPKGWADLIDPKWKHKIVYTQPADSGSAYDTATLLLQMWGDDAAAWAKLQQLIANTIVVNRSTIAFNGNGTGEYPLAISLEYAGFLWAHGGDPLTVIYPADGTMVDTEGVGLIKGAPHRADAEKLVDFLGSKAAQETFLEQQFRRPARSDIDVSVVKGMLPLSKIHLVVWDTAKWNAERPKVLSKLGTVIQNTR